MSLLYVSGICVQEDRGFVLNDISFTQQEFQKIAISGETGSGKSTLLKTIAGLMQPDTGEVLFDDERVKGPAERLVAGHPEIAYLSQQFELPQFLRVEQVLKYANTLSGEEADTLYEVCRIKHLLKRRTDELSGGERQRIALARLLTTWPRLLLLDEPYSNLDSGHKDILKSVIYDIGESLGITCTLISHDPLDTLSWANEIIVLKDGKILQVGKPEQIYRQPVNEYTAALFGSYNLIGAANTEIYSRLAGIKENGKKILVRPESFKIIEKDSEAITGTVTKITFFGSYYELTVSISEAVVRVKTVECNISEGDNIHLNVSPGDVWYV
ncbi:ABC transporter ATP-binding protein [Pontibacter silvestris]|uniref:ABC transporter ATP-binding protein n=1 Tax=Pontibacter silvestris TaxID=2305183 RepID=A0ABW4X049_9BACT|nr:ABC transporter ATP-binding protein [Pontibacter silvestris]MCC9135340.1 ABC transporter ATP-binding protein [Pontibacter silvestris]